MTKEITSLPGLETGRMEMEESPFNIVDFIRQVHADFADLALQKRSQFKWHNAIPEDLVSFWAKASWKK